MKIKIIVKLMKSIKEFFNYHKKRLFILFIRSRFLKTKVNFLLIMGLTMILQLHINIILCYLLMIDPYIDFFIQILITILIGFYTKYFLKIVLMFEESIYDITRYFIHNYSFENYRIWKRNVILFLCGYFILILLFYELEKFKIILQVIQTVVSFLILEKIETLPVQTKKEIRTRIVHDPVTGCTTYIKVYRKDELKIKRD